MDPRPSRLKQFAHSVTHLELRAADDLPAGVCGRIQGVALVYDSVDWYGTMFAPGCMARSIADRVNSSKVNLFLDHTKQVRCHVGVVRSMTDVGDTCVMVGDLFDTADGRLALEYCKAVIAAGAETGISIGFIPRKGEIVKDATGITTGNYRFNEIELREESITPVPAVEGALVTGARHEDENDPEVMVTALRSIVASLPAERLDAALLELGFQRRASEAKPEETASAVAAGDPAETAQPSAEGEGSRKMPLGDRIKLMRETLTQAA